MSSLSCGCDPEAVYKCELHRGWKYESSFPDMPPTPIVGARERQLDGSRLFGTDAQTRKGFPVFTGCLMYFPDALAALAAVSKTGNDQHNPGEPLHWARGKSTDQMDTATRHMMDHGAGDVKDADGGYHLAKAAWRILAELQLTIEKEREAK